MRTNNADLEKIIIDCFFLSMDGRIPRERQRQFKALGDELRDRLVILKVREFAAGDAEVAAANARIRAVNGRLERERARLDGIADTVEQLAALVAVIDDLINLPMVLV